MTEEMIIAGFGGQGVLSMGKILAYSGLMDDKEVTWMPSYGPEQRGGTANVTVILSDERISSPILNTYDTVIVLNQQSLDRFEKQVKPGGVRTKAEWECMQRRQTGRCGYCRIIVPACLRILCYNGCDKLGEAGLCAGTLASIWARNTCAWRSTAGARRWRRRRGWHSGRSGISRCAAGTWPRASRAAPARAWRCALR